MRRLILWLTVALGLLAAAPLPAQEPPQVFQIRGTGTLDVKGPRRRRGRLWQVELPISFRTVLEIDDSGAARIVWLSVRAPDLTVSRGRRHVYPYRCNSARTFGPVTGAVDPAGNLLFGDGTASIATTSFSERARDGGCPGTGSFTRITATNDRPITGWHDPAADLFQLDGSFSAAYDDEDIDIDISVEGSYDNRPPVAQLGVEGPGIHRIQGGCPPLHGLNPASVEANDPRGLRILLQSNSWDPDDRFLGSDLAGAQWEHWIGAHLTAGNRRLLGRGRRVGPVVFELDRQHTVVLRVWDQQRAEATTGCRFLVADTTPPAVVAPDPITVRCTVAGGATAATATRLEEFLAGGSASDLTDPAPRPLPPLAGGRPVADDTLFPGDETTQVRFRFQDRHGNVGTATSEVSVECLHIELGPSLVLADSHWKTIRPRIEHPDLMVVYLVSILSDGPEPPAKLVRGADFGSDDREFELLATPIETATGDRDRTYELVWIGVDATGRKTRITRRLVVEAGGGKSPPKQ